MISSDSLSVWNADHPLPSFMDHALTINDIPSLSPPNMANYTSGPLPNMLPDYVLINDTADFWPQSHSNGESESGSSSRGQIGDSPLSDGSAEGPQFPSTTSSSISLPWPVSVVLCPGDSTNIDWDRCENASVSFSKLLEKCSELDRSADMLQEQDHHHQRTTITHHHLPPILRAIDALCELFAASIDEHPAPCRKASLDPALLALVIAANFKILQVCSLLVSISVSETQTPHVQLLLKRIGFNLMQTKIALAFMKEQEMTSPSVFQTALDQAARIHRQILVMTKDNDGLSLS